MLLISSHVARKFVVAEESAWGEEEWAGGGGGNTLIRIAVSRLITFA